MRNLLGRLHARPPEDLNRIATFWQVPVSGGDHHRQVGQLYRALTNPRAVRAAWDRLDEHERGLVRALALGDGLALTVAELATHLGETEADSRQTAARLYRVGILAREGDDDPLPVGAVPRVFLPRELALLFRRIQDEIEAGDLSDTPLRALLELLDDSEIEEAAEIWGLRIIPGLRQRDDLSRLLLQQVDSLARVEAVAAKCRRDATAIWQRVRQETDNRPVPLAAAAAAAGITGDAPRDGQRLRDALAELERALLVWHSYQPDGSRWLFVPAEIRAPRRTVADDLPPPTPLAGATVVPPRLRHQHALAWDLLTLLRALSGVDAPALEADVAPPRAWLRHLNGLLWTRGEDTPPTGYVQLLVALALAEGLLERRDEPDTQALGMTQAVRTWRDRTFSEQTSRLLWWWQNHNDWIEGKARDDVKVWGADWRGLRRKLLALLSELEPNVWFSVTDVAAWAAGRDPDLLGPTFTAATAHHPGSDRDRRAAAIAEIVMVELETAFHPFGLVELASVPGQTQAARVTETLSALARETPPPTAPLPAGPPITITPEGEVLLNQPTPLRVWSLSAFADQARLGDITVYHLSTAALGRALAAGFDLDQVTAFLTHQSGQPLPSDVATKLTEWARSYGRVRLRRAVLISPDVPTTLNEIKAAAAGAGFPTHSLPDNTLLVEFPSDAHADDAESAEGLIALLREHGYTPQWARRSSSSQR